MRKYILAFLWLKQQMEANESHLQTFGCHVTLRRRDNREIEI